MLLYIVVGLLAYFAGMQHRNSPMARITKSLDIDKLEKELLIQQNLNASLLSEVQQYRRSSDQHKEEIWKLKQQVKKLQQLNKGKENGNQTKRK